MPAGRAAILILGLTAVLLGGALMVTRALRAPDANRAVAGGVTAPATVTEPGAALAPTSLLAPTLNSTTAPFAAATPAVTRAAPVAATTPPQDATPAAASEPARTTNALPVPPAAPVESTVVSIPIVSVDGTEQVIFPGTPTAVLPWWQRTDPAVPDTTAQPLLTGYLHFWDVRAQALSTLQPAALPQVMDGPPLTGEQAAIDQLRAAGQTQHVDVQHQIQILWATPQEGAVRDTLTDRSTFVPVDPTPNTPSSPPDASTYNMAYRLQLSGGTWKVIDSVRIVS